MKRLLSLLFAAFLTVAPIYAEEHPASQQETQTEIINQTPDTKIKEESSDEEFYRSLPSELKKLYQLPPDFVKEKDLQPEAPAEKRGDDNKHKLLEQLPPNVKRLNEIEKENPKDQKAEPQKEPQKPSPKATLTRQIIPPSESTKEGTLDKIIDTIFGKGKREKYPSSPLATEVIEDQDTSGIDRIKQFSEKIRDTEQAERLKPIDEIIKNAVKNSPDVQKAKLESEIVNRQNTFTPVPTFEIGNDFSTGKTLVNVGVILPLEPLFTGKAKETYARLNIRHRENEVTQRCIEQYTLIINTTRKLETRKKKKEFALQLLKNAQEQYNGGLIKLDDFIKAQELLWQVETEEESLKLDLETQTEKLRLIEKGGV
jgi:hypothetical protein